MNKWEVLASLYFIPMIITLIGFIGYRINYKKHHPILWVSFVPVFNILAIGIEVTDLEYQTALTYFFRNLKSINTDYIAVFLPVACVGCLFLL